MRRVKLTKQEKAVENALVQGEYVDVSKKDFDSIAKAIALRKKDAVLNIRINRKDLQNLNGYDRITEAINLFVPIFDIYHTFMEQLDNIEKNIIV